MQLSEQRRTVDAWRRLLCVLRHTVTPRRRPAFNIQPSLDYSGDLRGTGIDAAQSKELRAHVVCVLAGFPCTAAAAATNAVAAAIAVATIVLHAHGSTKTASSILGKSTPSLFYSHFPRKTED